MKIILSQARLRRCCKSSCKILSMDLLLCDIFDAFQKTGDLGPMMMDLMAYYYTNLIESLKFFQGDEGIIEIYLECR